MVVFGSEASQVHELAVDSLPAASAAFTAKVWRAGTHNDQLRACAGSIGPAVETAFVACHGDLSVALKVNCQSDGLVGGQTGSSSSAW